MNQSNEFTLALAIVKKLNYTSVVQERSRGASFTVPSGRIDDTLTFLSLRSIPFHTGFSEGKINIYLLKQ